MMHSFENIIDRYSISDTECVCLEDQSCLIFCQSTPFYVVGIVGHPNLQLMIEAAGYLGSFLVLKNLQNMGLSEISLYRSAGLHPK